MFIVIGLALAVLVNLFAITGHAPEAPHHSWSWAACGFGGKIPLPGIRIGCLEHSSKHYANLM